LTTIGLILIVNNDVVIHTVKEFIEAILASAVIRCYSSDKKYSLYRAYPDISGALVCHCLDNGKLYLCFIPALIGIFNTQFGTDIPVSSQDYLDIYEGDSINSRISDLAKESLTRMDYNLQQ
jgi:hypothetical protein